MSKKYGYAGLRRLNDASSQAADIRSRLSNKRSEDNDAARMTIHMERARLDYGSVADQITRDIENVLSDHDADMEPLFVY